MRSIRAAVAAVAMVLVTGCGADDSSPPTASTTTGGGTSVGAVDSAFPDVVEVAITPDGDTYRFDVTISSPYDSPERYADAWRVLASDGTVLGIRELTHDHADEQPFTRSLAGVVLPDGVDEVTIEARDLANGWGGATVTVAVP